MCCSKRSKTRKRKFRSKSRPPTTGSVRQARTRVSWQETHLGRAHWEKEISKTLPTQKTHDPTLTLHGSSNRSLQDLITAKKSMLTTRE